MNGDRNQVMLSINLSSQKRKEKSFVRNTQPTENHSLQTLCEIKDISISSLAASLSLCLPVVVLTNL